MYQEKTVKILNTFKKLRSCGTIIKCSTICNKYWDRESDPSICKLCHRIRDKHEK